MKVPKKQFKDRNAWLKWRHTKVGASDANVIMGFEQYKTKLSLMKEKSTLGFVIEPERKNTFMIEKGYERERERREYYKTVPNKNMRYHFVECYGISDKYPWLATSFDGLDVEREVVFECKVIGQKHIDEAKMGIPPTKYYPQCQTALYVSGYKQLILSMYCFQTKEGVDLFITKDDEYINKKLLPSLRRFRSNVVLLKRKNKKELV